MRMWPLIMKGEAGAAFILTLRYASQRPAFSCGSGSRTAALNKKVRSTKSSWLARGLRAARPPEEFSGTNQIRSPRCVICSPAASPKKAGPMAPPRDAEIQPSDVTQQN